MARGIRHSDQTRAAVLAALLEGQSVTQVAEAYQLDKKTVREWSRRAGISSPEVPPQKKEDLSDELVELIRENVATLKAQIRLYRDPAWVGKQNAADAAVLWGVIADKTIRLLSAMRPLDEEEGADS